MVKAKVTPFDTAIILSGGRLLAPVATGAARALGGKLTFRWRVAWRVRKRAGIVFGWRTYLGWLKTITTDELSSPVEEVQAVLAKRLDERLTANWNRWVESNEHLSDALRLVELTYPAIAAALGESDRVAVTEHWAQSRSTVLRAHLLEIAGPQAAISRADVARVLCSWSDARREVRLQAFDLGSAVIAPYLNAISVPSMTDGKVAILVGEYGSGKSETAEQWHRQAINTFNASDDAPLPVWLPARQVQNLALEQALEERAGPRWRSGRGVKVVIDGLDEIDPAAAQAVLDDARGFARTHERVQVLATARPGVVTAADLDGGSESARERLPIARLTEEGALSLIEQASGRESKTWHWTPDVRETVTRPFFALAAGVLLGSDSPPRSEVDLIRGLVDRALRRPSEHSSVTSLETQRTLVALAAQLTSRDREVLGLHERQVALHSRLVTQEADGGLRFALPIFQQWFSAQAILNGTISSSEVTKSAETFGRWRWAAAIAVASTSDDATVDDLLGLWVTTNPGAASWIIGEAVRGKNTWREDANGGIDPSTSGPRYLRALRTWATALGPAARGLVPRPVLDGPVELGALVQGKSLSIDLARIPPSADVAVTMSQDGRFSLVLDGVRSSWLAGEEKWMPYLQTSSTPPGAAWPWVMVKEDIARKTLEKLNTDPFLGSAEGIWTQERRYELALAVAAKPSWRREPVRVAEVQQRLADLALIRPLEDAAHFSFKSGSQFPSTEVRALREWCAATHETEIRSPLPPPDLPFGTGRWSWQDYSLQSLMAFEVEAYGRGCEAYDEAVTHHFHPFEWSLPGTALAPFGVALTIDSSPRGAYDDPLFFARRVPMEKLEEVAALTSDSRWSDTRRAVITPRNIGDRTPRDPMERIFEWYQEIYEAGHAHFGELISVRPFTPNNVRCSRPASEVAARWLWDDLQAIGLGRRGRFPKLRE